MNVQPLLHAISQVIGMTETVDSLVAQGADPDVVAALKARNVTGFSRLDAPLEQGMRTCIVGTLQRAGLQPDQVDTIVLLTESFEGPAGTDATS